MKRNLSAVLVIMLVFVLCSCGSTSTASTEKNISNKDIDFSSYSREELITMRDTINGILGEGSSVAVGDATSNIENPLPVVENGAPSSASDFVYVSNGSEIQINSYKGPGGIVTIPEEIDGLPVTRIGEKAFHDCDTISGVVLPETLKVIDDWAFAGISENDLGVVVLPKSLSDVGHFAFAYSNFSGVVIKCTCEFHFAFSTMPKLQFVYIESGAAPKLSDMAFAYDENLTTLIVPSSVTVLNKDNIFEGKSIVTIYTPEGSAAALYGSNHFMAVNTKDYDAMVDQYSIY